MRRMLWAVVLGVSIILAAPSVTARELGFSPNKQAGDLLTAIQKRDFKTFFDLSRFYQVELEQIKADNPKLLWDNLTARYYESKKGIFLSAQNASAPDLWTVLDRPLARPPLEPMDDFTALARLLTPMNQWVVIESRKRTQPGADRRNKDGMYVVYVSVKYKTVEDSPLVASKLCKETIVGVYMDMETGMFMQCKHVPAGDTFWDRVPLRILSVCWTADEAGGLALHVRAIGGTPPYRTAARAAGLVLEDIRGAKIAAKGDNIDIWVNHGLADKSFPLACSVEVVDAAGQKDVVSFTVSKRVTGESTPFCWIVNPWYRMGQGKPEGLAGQPVFLELARGAPKTDVAPLPPGSAPSPRPAKPGINRIAFVSKRDENWEIYVMNPDGGNQKRLTSNQAADTEPAWSPDGRRIAFVSTRNGNEEIYVMNADGGGPIRLTNNAAADRSPSWSPDGGKIVFASERDGNPEIYVMNANGTAQIRLTADAGNDRDSSWSPDGTKIAFASDRRRGAFEIYIMNADGTNPIRLTGTWAMDVDPAWSPDGTRIAFASLRDRSWEIYVINADGSGLARLTNNTCADLSPGWGPDGLTLSFASDRNGGWEIYTVNADGTNLRRLTNNDAEDKSPAWSAG